MPRFGQRKNVGGKNYVYQRNSRGGNYGSWMRDSSSDSAQSSGASLSGAKSDFSRSSLGRTTQEEAEEILNSSLEFMDKKMKEEVFSYEIDDLEDEKKFEFRFFAPFSSYQQSINRNPYKPSFRSAQPKNTWDEKDIHDAEVIEEMVNVFDDTSLSDDEKLKQLRSLQEEMTSSVVYKLGDYMHKTAEGIITLHQTASMRRSRSELDTLVDWEPQYTNPGIIYPPGRVEQSMMDKDDITRSYYESPFFFAAVNDVIKGDDNIPVDRDNDNEVYYLDGFDRSKMNIVLNQQVVLSSVFPERELKESMKRSGISGVYIDSFANGREFGNVYSVITPDNETMSFSVYEHRNTDSIIINGKRNWDSHSGELPYHGEKNEFFAEIPHNNYQLAADTLTFFLREAQNGELKDENTLVEQAPRIDHNTILARDIGDNFVAFLDKFAPDEGQRVRKELSGDKKSDDDILRGLDF